MAAISCQKLIFFLVLCLVSIHGALSLDLEAVDTNCGKITREKALLSLIDSALVGTVSVTPLRDFTERLYRTKDNSVIVISRCQVNMGARNCGKCISTAASEMLDICPNTEEATIWFKECYLHYRRNGRPVAKIGFQIPDTRYAPLQCSLVKANNQEQFTEDLSKLYNTLIGSTVKETNEKRFYYDAIKTSSSETIYGMMQCNENYGERACLSCLQTAKKIMVNSVCWGKTDCHFIGSGCVIRYDTTPFLDSKP